MKFKNQIAIVILSTLFSGYLFGESEISKAIREHKEKQQRLQSEKGAPVQLIKKKPVQVGYKGQRSEFVMGEKSSQQNISPAPMKKPKPLDVKGKSTSKVKAIKLPPPPQQIPVQPSPFEQLKSGIGSGLSKVGEMTQSIPGVQTTVDLGKKAYEYVPSREQIVDMGSRGATVGMELGKKAYSYVPSLEQAKGAVASTANVVNKGVQVGKIVGTGLYELSRTGPAPVTQKDYEDYKADKEKRGKKKIRSYGDWVNREQDERAKLSNAKGREIKAKMMTDVSQVVTGKTPQQLVIKGTKGMAKDAIQVQKVKTKRSIRQFKQDARKMPGQFKKETKRFGGLVKSSTSSLKKSPTKAIKSTGSKMKKEVKSFGSTMKRRVKDAFKKKK